MASFSEALNKIKDGHKLQRPGWNGKGMYIFLVGEEICFADGGLIDNITIQPFICMYTADKKYVPWLASQTDLLAEDWEIVE